MEEENKEERPEPNYFMSYENDKWVLNIKDPVTKEVIEKKVAVQGGRWAAMGGQRSAVVSRRRK